MMSKLREWLSALRSLTSTRRLLAQQAQQIHALQLDAEALRRESVANLERLRSDSAQQIDQLRSEGAQQIDQLRSVEAEHATQVRGEFQASVRELHAKLSEVSQSLQEEHGAIRAAANEMYDRLGTTSVKLERVLDRLDRVAPEFPELPNLNSNDSSGWFYASFEETFRGTRELVMQRLQVYLPYVEPLHANPSDALTALDLGCGRGEWLEVMRDQGIDALGVDANPVTIERCRQRDLKAIQGDVLDFLRVQPAEAFDLISSFHVIEHLPTETLAALLLEIRRVIRPRGIVILETPNSQNLVVGASSFYLDPTHRHPLPSALLKFLVEWARLEIVEILPLHPDEALVDVAGREGWPPTLQRLLSGPQDVGVVAKPALQGST